MVHQDISLSKNFKVVDPIPLIKKYTFIFVVSSCTSSQTQFLSFFFIFVNYLFWIHTSIFKAPAEASDRLEFFSKMSTDILWSDQ